MSEEATSRAVGPADFTGAKGQVCLAYRRSRKEEWSDQRGVNDRVVRGCGSKFLRWVGDPTRQGLLSQRRKGGLTRGGTRSDTYFRRIPLVVVPHVDSRSEGGIGETSGIAVTQRRRRAVQSGVVRERWGKGSEFGVF